MNQSKTIGIKSVKHLCAVLKTTPKEIEELIIHKEKYYYLKLKAKKDDHGHLKRDADGQIIFRELYPSKGRLKEIQEIIRHRILLAIPMPPNIKGGVKGSSNIANAKAHLGKKYKFKTDMKRYYPSISPERVYQLFRNYDFSNKCCSILTHLTTYKYELPQGTPTSTDIANRVFLKNDKKIINFCLKRDITYTRYIDDLVFSCPLDFRQDCVSIVNFVLAAGFRVSVKKTKYCVGNMEITGVDVKNNVLDLSDYFKSLLKDDSIPENITTGRKNYLKQVRKKQVKKK